MISLLVILCGFGLRGKISGNKFDSEKWKNANSNLEQDWALRWDMMNSLRNNYDLIGMSKKEIITLLGKPDGDFSYDNTLEYFLGYTHTGINTGALRIKFTNDIVESISVRQG